MTDSSVTGRNQNHSDVRDESARDNDPLFELSRIFGFEEPTGQTNAHNPQTETEYSSEISLERELMADFDAEFATEFAAQPSGDSYGGQFAEPENNQTPYQPVQDSHQDYVQPLSAESYHVEPVHHTEPVVEPRFTGYAPLQRAYAENKTGLDAAPVVQEPVFGHEEPQYYATHQDYFSSVENELSEGFAATETAHAGTEQAFDLNDFNLTDLGFDEIGREPHQEFAAQPFDNADDINSYLDAEQLHVEPPVYAPVQPAADLSFEDELAFLLHDDAPAVAAYTPAAVEPAYSSYSAPTYTAAAYETLQPPVLDEPILYDEPLVPETDFAPLFDTPANEFVPVASSFDAEEEAAHDYSNPEPAHNYAPVEDEFFAAPDLSHLPNRTSSTYSYIEEESAEEEAPVTAQEQEHSFSDLFGATSQTSYEPEPEPVLPISHPASHPVSHNAVRGFSNYSFGAATPAAGAINQVVNNYAGAETAASYAPAHEPVAAGSYYEEPAATSEEFFNNDDFDFSFDEEVQAADDYPIAAAVEEEPEQPVYQPSYTSVSKTFAPAPEIEAVSVSENKVEQTQTLDLPDVSFGDDAKATGLNSLESEFAEIFSTISVTEAATPDTTSEADKAFENILHDNFADYHASVKADADHAAAQSAYGIGAMGGLAAAAVAGAASRGSSPQAATGATAANATQDDYYNHWAAQGAQTNDFDTYNLGDNFSRDEQQFDDYRPREENPLRKPILWASVAAVALVVLGGGYYALKSGGVVGGEPAVLRADTQPIKTQPENPGGTVVPNQDKAVYDRVSGNKPAVPEQKTLINTEEEPVDVGLLQGQDAEEDRLSDEQEDTNATTQPSATANPQEAQRELIAPRTVRTMVVRADGTIVPGEAPAVSPEPAPTDTGLDEASRLISQGAVPERLGTEKPAASAQSAATPRVVQTQSFTASGEQVKPREVATAPVVPSRPASQPVNVVGNVERPVAAQPAAQAPQQVASANVANANVPAGTWFIQVASQPSAELAQKNYANLTSRYGNVIGGRGVDIKKADIPGKGTYYRVRIPGGSKAEAAALCERLKSAGGSCFPTL